MLLLVILIALESLKELVCSLLIGMNLCETILLNIMFHAPIGRFQLELIYYFTYFSTVVPSNSCVFLSCRPFVVNMTFSTGLVGFEVSPVSYIGQLTVGIVLTTKGLQERNTQLLADTTVEK